MPADEIRHYNEPWSYQHPHIKDCKGANIYPDARNKEYATNCVNALAGKDHTELPRLLERAKTVVADPCAESLANLKQSLDRFYQRELKLTVGQFPAPAQKRQKTSAKPKAATQYDADVRGMIETIKTLTTSVVELTAVNRHVFEYGSNAQIARAVRLRPRSMNGWRSRAVKALKEASFYVAIPAPPQITEADYREEPIDDDYRG